MKIERDNKFLDTILDHNTSLLKHTGTLHQNPCSSKSPSDTTDKNFWWDFQQQVTSRYTKKNQSKKGSKETKERIVISDNKKNGNNVVYILGESMMTKHVNGRNVSDSTNVRKRSRPGATTEDLIDYVKPIARKKMLVIHTGTNDFSNDMNAIKEYPWNRR